MRRLNTIKGIKQPEPPHVNDNIHILEYGYSYENYICSVPIYDFMQKEGDDEGYLEWNYIMDGNEFDERNPIIVDGDGGVFVDGMYEGEVIEGVYCDIELYTEPCGYTRILCPAATTGKYKFKFKTDKNEKEYIFQIRAD